MSTAKKMEKDLQSLSQKYEDAISGYYNLLEKLSPLNVKSKYITCRECGSKLNTEKMHKHIVSCSRLKCPVCGNKTALYSTTNNSRLEASKKRCDEAKRKYFDLQAKIAELDNDNDTNHTQEDGLKEVRERLELIYREIKTPDFVEIHGEIGGDVLCYRVYNDGSVYEK